MKPIRDSGWVPREWGRERTVGPFSFQWVKDSGSFSIYLGQTGLVGIGPEIDLKPDDRYPHEYLVDSRGEAVKAAARFVALVYPGHGGRTRKR